MQIATATTAPVYGPNHHCVSCSAHRDDPHNPWCLWAEGEPRGLTVDVLRLADGGDFTRGGISSRHTRLTVVAVVDRVAYPDRTVVQPVPRDWRVAAPNEDAPAVALVKRNIGRTVWSIAPLDCGLRWYMYGGNHAHTSDSRFSQLTEMYGAVAIHDRCEQ